MQLHLVLLVGPTLFLGLNLQGCSSPSTVPGCPDSYVDCGTCLCVPKSTCQWCPGGGSSFLAVPTANMSVATPVEAFAAPADSILPSSILAVDPTAKASAVPGNSSGASP